METKGLEEIGAQVAQEQEMGSKIVTNGRLNVVLTLAFVILSALLIYNIVGAKTDYVPAAPGNGSNGQGYIAGNGNGSGGDGCCGTGSGSSGAPSGGITGGGGCCSNGKSITKDQAKKQAIDFYAKKYGDKDVTAKVEDYGCHLQVNLYKGDKLVKAISFRGGKLAELN